MSANSSTSKLQNKNPFTLAAQNAKRTRSQAPALEFNISLERSPLKEAKNAIRKANVTFHGEEAGESPSGSESSHAGPSRMTTRDVDESMCVDSEPAREDELLLSPRKHKPQIETTKPSQKRANSPPFGGDDEPSSSGSRSSGHGPSKRKKVGPELSGPLPMLFARQLAKQPTPKSSPANFNLEEDMPSRAVPTAPRRTVSDNIVSLSRKDEEAASTSTPATMTIPKDVPHFDLKRCTPSPRKAAVGLGLGAPHVSIAKAGLRMISEGKAMFRPKLFKSYGVEVEVASKAETPQASAPVREPPETGSESGATRRNEEGATLGEGEKMEDSDVPVSQDSQNVTTTSSVNDTLTIVDEPPSQELPASAERVAPSVNDEPITQRVTLGIIMAPLSPLTPLPPRIGLLGEEELEEPESADTVAASSTSTSSSLSTAQVMSQSSGNLFSGTTTKGNGTIPRKSLLPRPSSILFTPKAPTSALPTQPPPLPNAASTSTVRAPLEAPKFQPPAAKRKIKPSNNLYTPKMTRSATLRQKQVQIRASSVQPVPIVASVAAAGATAAGPSKPLRDVRHGKEPGAKKPPPRRASTCPPESPTRPTRSAGVSDSRDEAKPEHEGSPTKAKPRAPPLARARTELLIQTSPSDDAAKSRSHSTLNTLNVALAKLALPPPPRPVSRLDKNSEFVPTRPRPSTSMGFNSDSNNIVERRLGTKLLSKAGSTSGVSGPSIDKGKRPQLPPPPAFKFGDKCKNSAGAKPFRFGLGPHPSSNPGLKRPMFPAGAGTGIFNRPVPRMKASQRTTLDTVVASPAKAGLSSTVAVSGAGTAQSELGEAEDEDVMDISTLTVQSLLGSGAGNSSKVDVSMGSEGTSQSQDPAQAQAANPNYRAFASRRASIAFSSLSQSMNESMRAGLMSNGNTSGASADASATSSHRISPLNASTSKKPPSKTVPTAQQSSFGRTIRPPSRALPMSSSDPVEVPDDATNEGHSSNTNANGKKKSVAPAGALGVLKSCVIFVDVRTEEGEDAGDLFVDMLKGLGAKVLTRVGQTCTHIVYKNGLASTLTRYRLLDEPRPLVIGIGWVVECAEKRTHVDEERFKVDIETMNAAALNKQQHRRKSMMPKQLPVNGPMDAFLNGRPVVDSSFEPPSDDGDISEEGTSLANLTPLEKARQRIHLGQ